MTENHEAAQLDHAYASGMRAALAMAGQGAEDKARERLVPVRPDVCSQAQSVCTGAALHRLEWCIP